MNQLILLVAQKVPELYTGSGKAAWRIAHHLHAKGQLVALLTSTHTSDLADHPFEVKSVIPVKFLDHSLFRLLRELIAFVNSWVYIWKRRNDFDILHCVAPSWDALYAVLMSKLFGKRVVLELTLLGHLGDNPGNVASYDWFRILYQRKNIQYQLADRIVCLSEALRLDCEQHGLGSKTVVIPRSVNTERFNPVTASRKKELRSELGLPDENIILFVGSLISRKGALRLVPILKLIRTRVSTHLVIVGNGAVSDDEIHCTKVVQSQFKSDNLEQVVHLIGITDQVERYNQAADVFFFPSESEGMPNAVLEAMSSGNPVVCGLIPGITDTMMVDGQSGYVCDQFSDEDYASLIVNLLQNAELMQQIGQLARQKIMQEYTESSIFARYQHLYDSL